MPSKRRVRGGADGGPKRRSARQRQSKEEIPHVYMEMLAEVAQEDDAVNGAAAASLSSPRKRRKLSEGPHGESSTSLGMNEESGAGDIDSPECSRLQQMELDDFSASSDDDGGGGDDDEEDDDDEDADFEDVEIGAFGNAAPVEDQQSLEIDLSKKHPRTSRGSAQQRRKIVSATERALRLSVHKTHLLLLLLSISRRNRWCESSEVQAILKPLVRKKTIKQLHLDDTEPQWKRSTAFNDAVKEIAEMWRATYNINVRGMRRAHWRSEINMEREMDEAEDMLDFDDFKTCAQLRSGSRDLSAQLFCALLRACGVDTRLVCSLQVLPFSAASAVSAQQVNPDGIELSTAKYVRAPAQDYGSSAHSSLATTTTANLPATASQRNNAGGLNESPYPIFWVEVYSPAISTWIPVDPLVRNTFNKPKTGFEPPASDPLNAMSYVIAFEGDDNSARDVTRRYAQWFNAKTRKTRVESTKGGVEWYASVMNFFAKSFTEDRDAIEDIELARRNELEGMPRSIQDFKGHPLYVLERHLRRNEVVHPRREAGRVLAGSGGGGKGPSAHKKLLELVFRRKDVHVCRSADSWYRRGRDIIPGETSLKHAVRNQRQQQGVRRLRGAQNNGDEDEDEDSTDATALYAEFQTQPYRPPPVVDERVPRNSFGNIDVYVPSMIPAGGIHVRHPLAARAAQVLGIDYVEAVTGFEFKGRHGTAVIDGVVVSATQRVAMVAVIVGLQNQATEEAERHRSRVLLGIWKKWLAALRIKQQIANDYGGGESLFHQQQQQQQQQQRERNRPESDTEDSTYHDDDGGGGGGFFIEDSNDESGNGHGHGNDHGDVPLPLTLPDGKLLDDDLPPPHPYREIVVVDSPNKLPMAGTVQETEPIAASREGGEEEEEEDLFGDGDAPSGGFVPEPGDEGGGFLIEDNAEEDAAPVPATSTDEPGKGAESIKGGSDADAQEALAHVSPEPEPEPESEAVNAAAPPPPLRSESTQSSALLGAGDDDEEDRLSHDPDEDEAEPEWLNESLGID